MTLGFIEWNGNLYTIKNIPACSPNKGCEVLQKFLENETDVTVELKKNLKYKNNKLKKNIKLIAAIDLLIENKLLDESVFYHPKFILTRANFDLEIAILNIQKQLNN
jgi:hypothetical protein